MATFRRDHRQPLRQVCRACTLGGKPLALFAGELVAIEGSTFTAGPAKERNFPQRQLQRLLPQMEAHSEGYLKARDRGDPEAAPGPSGGTRAESLQAKIAPLQARKRKLHRDIWNSSQPAPKQ
jgi:hypothetical protein